LLTKLRADLTIAMFTDSKPKFFRDDISWGPYIAKGQKTSLESLPRHFAGLDMKLSNIWADLREFTKSANLAFQTGQKMDGVLFQEILISVQYDSKGSPPSFETACLDSKGSRTILC
jgi:hypothetical protein